MATIVLSVAGEGRGHASRAKTVIEHLRREHRVVLLAPSVAYDLLAAAYAETPQVAVHRIPGLHFSYRGHKLDYLKSLTGSIPYLRRVSSSVRSRTAATPVVSCVIPGRWSPAESCRSTKSTVSSWGCLGWMPSD
jgi:hypothetical protein